MTIRGILGTLDWLFFQVQVLMANQREKVKSQFVEFYLEQLTLAKAQIDPVRLCLFKLMKLMFRLD